MTAWVILQDSAMATLGIVDDQFFAKCIDEKH